MSFPRSLTCFLAVSLVSSAAALELVAPEFLPAQTGLPDPLLMFDGSRVQTKEEWREKRLRELRTLFQHYMYGQRPRPLRPVPRKLVRIDASALGGKATLKEIEVQIGLAEPVHLLLVIPNERAKPAACFLGLNFAGNYALLNDPLVQMPRGWVYEKYAGAPEHQAAEAARGSEANLWAIEQSIDRGYAVATFYNGDVIPDQVDLARERLARFASAESAAGAEPATIMVWAWAFSQLIDYLESEPDIDAKRIAAVGHSRNGKTALLAAAFDERIALVIPSQAGCGGSAPSRVAPELAQTQEGARPKAETLAVINRNFPHWFCGNFKAFSEHPEQLPFDQHALIAMCAPRPVLLSNAAEDVWANPTGQFEMLKAADPVYRLVAGDGLGASEMPTAGILLDSRLGYFIRAGKHSMTREDWKVWLDYADKWLK